MICQVSTGKAGKGPSSTPPTTSSPTSSNNSSAFPHPSPPTPCSSPKEASHREASAYTDQEPEQSLILSSPWPRHPTMPSMVLDFMPKLPTTSSPLQSAPSTTWPPTHHPSHFSGSVMPFRPSPSSQCPTESQATNASIISSPAHLPTVPGTASVSTPAAPQLPSSTTRHPLTSAISFRVHCLRTHPIHSSTCPAATPNTASTTSTSPSCLSVSLFYPCTIQLQLLFANVAPPMTSTATITFAAPASARNSSTTTSTRKPFSPSSNKFSVQQESPTTPPQSKQKCPITSSSNPYSGHSTSSTSPTTPLGTQTSLLLVSPFAAPTLPSTIALTLLLPLHLKTFHYTQPMLNDVSKLQKRGSSRQWEIVLSPATQ